MSLIGFHFHFTFCIDKSLVMSSLDVFYSRFFLVAAPNNNRFTGGGGSLSSTSPGGGSSSLISQLIQHSSMKNILALFFLPVALPYLMYKFIIAFRKRYGLKMRRLEGKVWISLVDLLYSITYA